jgi:hypothetical protein
MPLHTGFRFSKAVIEPFMEYSQHRIRSSAGTWLILVFLTLAALFFGGYVAVAAAKLISGNISLSNRGVVVSLVVSASGALLFGATAACLFWRTFSIRAIRLYSEGRVQFLTRDNTKLDCTIPNDVEVICIQPNACSIKFKVGRHSLVIASDDMEQGECLRHYLSVQLPDIASLFAESERFASRKHLVKFRDGCPIKVE